MKEKYYRVRAEVNLKTIHENLENVRKKINPKSKLMVIIKADAYGHGAAETVRQLMTLLMRMVWLYMKRVFS